MYAITAARKATMLGYMNLAMKSKNRVETDGYYEFVKQ